MQSHRLKKNKRCFQLQEVVRVFHFRSLGHGTFRMNGAFRENLSTHYFPLPTLSQSPHNTPHSPHPLPRMYNRRQTDAVGPAAADRQGRKVDACDRRKLLLGSFGSARTQRTPSTKACTRGVSGSLGAGPQAYVRQTRVDSRSPDKPMARLSTTLPKRFAPATSAAPSCRWCLYMHTPATQPWPLTPKRTDPSENLQETSPQPQTQPLSFPTLSSAKLPT
jgi:hypothetical protein